MSSGPEPTVFRPNAVSYLRIPAGDPRLLARFYESVFGWRIRTGREEPAFTDGSGHVIGHFVSSQAPAGEDGFRPYVFVESVEATLARARSAGAELVAETYPEGNLLVATFRDPAGNVVGVWQTAA